MSDDLSDERLSALLTRAVEDVEPADRLDGIRARVARPARRWLGWGVPTGALLAAAAAAVAVAIAVLPDALTTAPDPASPGSTAVPVYYVGDAAGGPALFREFRRSEQPVDLDLLTAEPDDPDYRTSWPEGSLAGFVRSSTVPSIEVELTGWVPRGRPGDMTAREARLTVQQLVYTLDAMLQERHKVSFVRDGEPVTMVFGVRVADGVIAAPPLDVLGLVNISDPAEGTAVSGSFTARGVASSFEATVPWELRDEEDAVVRDGFATAEGWADRLHPWETEVDVSGLPPGSYTFAAMTDDPTAGTEGPGPTTDTRTVVVQ